MHSTHKVILSEHFENSETIDQNLEECDEDETQELLNLETASDLINQNNKEKREDNSKEFYIENKQGTADQIDRKFCENFSLIKKVTELEDDVLNGDIYYKQNYEGGVVCEYLDLTRNTENLKTILNDHCLAKYMHQIINLCSFYKCYKCEEYPDKGFFYTNHYIFNYLNANDSYEFIKDILKRESSEKQNEILDKLNQLKKVVELYCKNSSQIDYDTFNDFDQFLAFLIHGDHKCLDKYHNVLKHFVTDLSANLEKRQRDVKDITTAFLCLILDLPNYRILVDTESRIEMKIFSFPITNQRIFDHDVMYIFSKIKPSHDGELNDYVNIKSNNLTKDEVEVIKEMMQLNNVTKCIEFTSITENQSVIPKIVDCIFAFLSVIEPILILLWLSKNLFFMTIIFVASIWINWIVDLNSNFTKCNYLRRFQEHISCNLFNSNSRLNIITVNNFLRFLSFFKFAAFLKTINVTMLYWKRKERLKENKRFKLLVDNIIYGFPEYIEESLKRSNSDEMYFNLINFVQIYQISRIVKNQTINGLQILGISFRIFIMIKTTLTFAGIRERRNLIDFLRHPNLVFREVFYFGFWFIFNGLLLSQIVSYKLLFTFGFYFLHFYIAASCTDDKGSNRKAFIFFGTKFESVNYWTVFTYFTIIEYISIISLVFVFGIANTHEKQKDNFYFIGLLSLGTVFFIGWLILVGFNNFYDSYNPMHLFWHMQNNGSIIIDKENKLQTNNENESAPERERNLIFLRKDLSEDLKTIEHELKDTPLTKYVHEIANLFTLHKYYDCEKFSNKDFIQRNKDIFKYFDVTQLNQFDEFIGHQLSNKSNETKEEINGNWNQLKEFVQNAVNNPENSNECSSNDFIFFLKFLVTETEDLYLNQFCTESHQSLRKRRLDFESFTKIFFCLVLNLPAYHIQLDEASPIEVKIFKISTSDSDFIKEDVMYIFTHDDGSNRFPSENFSNSKINPKNSKMIRKNIKLDKSPNCVLISTVTEMINKDFMQEKYIKILISLISLVSVTDMVLDLQLAYDYWKDGQNTYSRLTLAIVTIAGIVNLLANEYFLHTYSNLIKYNYFILNFLPIRYVLSFIQLSTFLKTQSATVLFLKRDKRRKNKEELELFLDNIIHGHPEYMEENKKVTSFIEMVFESIPQAILQMYIVVQTNFLSPKQSLKISLSIFSMIYTTLQFVAVAEEFQLVDFIKKAHITALLKEILYIVFTTISYSLLFYIFPLRQSIYWMIFLIALSLSCSASIHTKNNSLILLGKKIKSVNYWTLFNYVTIVKTVVYFICFGMCILSKKCRPNHFFDLFYVVAFIAFCYWVFIIWLDNFEHAYNFMYLPWHIRNRTFSREKKTKPKQNGNSDIV